MTNLKFHAKALATGLGLLLLGALAIIAFSIVATTIGWLFVYHGWVAGGILFTMVGLVFAHSIGRDFLEDRNYEGEDS